MFMTIVNEGNLLSVLYLRGNHLEFGREAFAFSPRCVSLKRSDSFAEV